MACVAEDSSGHVWLVGAGPGDPGLITVAGARALADADAVLYDALVAPALLRGTRPGAELIFVGKRAARHALPQEEIEALLVAKARAGAKVVRLKGGDPFVFGRGGEEALACRRAGIGFTVVPGITSAIAAPAYAGIPVTHRGLSGDFLVITASEGESPGAPARIVDWDAAARAGTLVVLMGATSLADCAARLLASGMAPGTPAAAIRWGTRPDQQVVTAPIETIADAVREARLGAPIVTVIGDVAALAADLAWFVPGPLAGKRVVVTRARAQSSGLAAKFEALGAFVVEAPVIGIRQRGEDLVTDERAGSRWDWIVFTSANGADVFFAALAAAGRDARTLGATQVAAVGEATAAALRAHGVSPDFTPTRAISEALADELPRVRGARILLPVSALTHDRLAEALRKRGGLVEQVAVYENVAEPLDAERLREIGEADAITFTSASTARFLREALAGSRLPAAAKLVSIGPQTSAAVRECFGRIDREAAEPSLEALVAATQEALSWAT
ncbi:MAG: uroporphyrinogen-III C-methyltransferase [Chloroflexi bacterium]|nr:uroporphyrinogen-III C-methyltransferase [Chloroflexota bacterium]